MTALNSEAQILKRALFEVPLRELGIHCVASRFVVILLAGKK
jgi:hypothetical protein